MMKTRVHGWAKSTYSDSEVYFPSTPDGIREVVTAAALSGKIISARGAGNAYGDNALNTQQIILDLSGMNRILEFDPLGGLLRVEAGADINSILLSAIPHGWMLPAMPGTRHVSVGGALANNVHGKNCIHVGYFGEHVLSFKICLADGSLKECSREQNSEIFYSAISGLGLLGITYEATLQLRRVPSFYLRQRERSFGSLAEIVDAYEELKGAYDYSICQMDAIKSGPHLGRGTLQLANFEHDGDYHITRHEIPKRMLAVVPHSVLPVFTKQLLGTGAVRCINTLKYQAVRMSNQERDKRVSFSTMHFLMDRQLPRYNSFFKHGFFEYQAMLPTRNAVRGFSQLLKLSHQYGFGSMMSAFKAHRKLNEPFLMTPALDGYSITMDIVKRPAEMEKQLEMFYAMNEIVIENEGMLYLAKTPVIHERHFRAMYPNVDKFLMLKSKWDPDSRFQSNLYRRIFQLKWGDLPPPAEFEI